ncbi:hypothetical protein NBRC111894_3224 [Sporolactobacillus inulinus]|uniref:Uncharacterized protein n=1 Tax=Sporolactobacillus inulinus TaxID=2078 RepID=A0A4Y1ZFF3_9BACL|nr:hypothetical protein NBRC111894_3224 [Sporolactobacillus inulinus]
MLIHGRINVYAFTFHLIHFCELIHGLSCLSHHVNNNK